MQCCNPKTAGDRIGRKLFACRGVRLNNYVYLCPSYRLWTGIIYTFGGENQMPNASVLEKKQQQVAELAEKISGAVTGVIVDYKGITVADDTALRKELRENGVDYFVVKNTILGRAIDGTSVEGMKSVLEGTTAIALSKEDYTAAARILCKFAEGHDSFKVKSGFLDGQVVDIATIESLAKLPTKEVLLATVCSAFQAPIAAFARALQAIVDKDGTADAE